MTDTHEPNPNHMINAPYILYFFLNKTGNWAGDDTTEECIDKKNVLVEE